ncbi:hypothetical protein K2173_020041 [Erythroxylum novogranatense]|uniref:Uncharacterized protein n=1 Tax=Erythroxylum novogranatense TaxID=1862640 RepID=A0AAV8U6T4_9ROSI|nr:hypothetical protein K2173_020041 [Erythroxylum novogranatense]
MVFCFMAKLQRSSFLVTSNNRLDGLYRYPLQATPETIFLRSAGIKMGKSEKSRQKGKSSPVSSQELKFPHPFDGSTQLFILKEEEGMINCGYAEKIKRETEGGTEKVKGLRN